MDTLFIDILGRIALVKSEVTALRGIFGRATEKVEEQKDSFINQWDESRWWEIYGWEQYGEKSLKKQLQQYSHGDADWAGREEPTEVLIWKETMIIGQVESA